MVRVERSSFCIFAYVENHPEEEREVSIEKTKYISKVGYYPMVHVVSLNEPNDFAWKNAVMELDLLLKESRGYWKYHAPTNWFNQAKASRKINNDRANLLFYSAPRY